MTILEIQKNRILLLERQLSKADKLINNQDKILTQALRTEKIIEILKIKFKRYVRSIRK